MEAILGSRCVVNANPPYIQTYADGKQTDNLLYLPRY